ncbi:glycoside hydrolase family 28 protein [Gonapodya prolifera JEL478]|uniref:Glycoside hydrolase family 28 protein n=1 Tax=Gonapodya prolifera (strain JEL478) TaxID=1344416 RepID=A0A139A4Y7_GONPJ|nr:glycoside hydrolase family 28 protein [Gonapodya prolifera JEL478]|eukprot:KXS11850.1 glycoside hydrolase family 28 protein [Gonapodya prolifera JEL478]
MLLTYFAALLALTVLAPLGSAARAKCCPVTGGTTDDSKAILAAVTPGKGTIDINGTSFQTQPNRPVGLAITGLNVGSVTGLNLKNSGLWYNWISFSKNVAYDNINIVGVRLNGTGANTDGWDIYNSDHITIKNSLVINGDDCISFKPNSTNIFDVTCTNCQHGARIKVWPGSGAGATSDGLSGGGGSGLVKNITFDGVTVKGGDQDALLVTGCYGQPNVTICKGSPTTFKIQDVFFKRVTGDVKGKDQAVGRIICPSGTTCTNINVLGLNVTSLTGNYTNQLLCDNIDTNKILAPATCHV